MLRRITFMVQSLCGLARRRSGQLLSHASQHPWDLPIELRSYRCMALHLSQRQLHHNKGNEMQVLMPRQATLTATVSEAISFLRGRECNKCSSLALG